jgi:hypothetical protein
LYYLRFGPAWFRIGTMLSSSEGSEPHLGDQAPLMPPLPSHNGRISSNAGAADSAGVAGINTTGFAIASDRQPRMTSDCDSFTLR